MKRKIPPLIIEHFEELDNLHLLSVVEYNRQEFTCIIDDITHNQLKVFVLDLAVNQNAISRSNLISEAIYWFYNDSANHQFSVHLAKRGLSHLAIPVFRTFNISNISRVFGKVFHYPELVKVKVKRKRVMPIPEGVEIYLKKIQN